MGVKYSSITESGSIIDALITDRTASDVSEAVSLAQKISTGNATEAEITEFLTVMKGSYKVKVKFTPNSTTAKSTSASSTVTKTLKVT